MDLTVLLRWAAVWASFPLSACVPMCSSAVHGTLSSALFGSGISCARLGCAQALVHLSCLGAGMTSGVEVSLPVCHLRRSSSWASGTVCAAHVAPLRLSACACPPCPAGKLPSMGTGAGVCFLARTIEKLMFFGEV